MYNSQLETQYDSLETKLYCFSSDGILRAILLLFLWTLSFGGKKEIVEISGSQGVKRDCIDDLSAEVASLTDLDDPSSEFCTALLWIMAICCWNQYAFSLDCRKAN